MSKIATTSTTGPRETRLLLDPLQDEIVQLLQQLVRTNSVAIPPHGSETAAQKVLQEFLRGHDIDCELYDLEFLSEVDHPYLRTDRDYSARHNLIARIKGSGHGRSLLLSGHIDTVPAGLVDWQDDPWAGVVRDGRLYGRGSYDMKGGLAAAFVVPVALKQAGIQLNGDLFCESVVDEEWGGGGGTLAARLRGDIADACIIPEPTNLTIYRATRGGYIVDLEVRAGDPDDYFSKAEVVSPAIPLGRLLNWIDHWSMKRRTVAKSDAYLTFSDPAPVQVLAIEANSFDKNVPLSVPLMTRVRLYLQFQPHEDVTSVISEIRNSLETFCDADPFFTVHRPAWKPLFDPPLIGHELAESHEWVRTFADSFTTALNVEPAITGAEFPCDAFLNQTHFGIPTLIFGPKGGGAHNMNEYVEIESVFETAEVLLAAALNWCGTSS